MGEVRLPGEWRVGDIVRVDESVEVTNLGEGVIVDVDTYPDSDHARAVLVRFEHGPAAGVWYSVGTLRQLRDLYGNELPTRVPEPVCADLGTAVPVPDSPEHRTVARVAQKAVATRSVVTPKRPQPRRVVVSEAATTPGGMRVLSTFGDGLEGRVVESPPRFPDGRSWPEGWLRVRWSDGSVCNVHSMHVVEAHGEGFIAGDVVEWFMHPGKLRGVVRRRVHGHFFEIELFDPPTHQARQVRLTATPIRLAPATTTSATPTASQATPVEPARKIAARELTGFQQWWRDNEQDLASDHYRGGHWTGVYHLLRRAYLAGSSGTVGTGKLTCATCDSKQVFGLYYYSPSKTLMAYCEDHRPATTPCVLLFHRRS